MNESPAAAGVSPAAGASARLPRRTRLHCRSGPLAPSSTLTTRDGSRHRIRCPVSDFLTPAQLVAKYKNAVSRSTIYSACQDGMLTHYRVPAKKGARGKYLIKESDFLSWLESLRRGDVPAASTSSASSGSPGGLFSELDSKRLAKAWKGK
jgi:hypothetical protein